MIVMEMSLDLMMTPPTAMTWRITSCMPFVINRNTNSISHRPNLMECLLTLKDIKDDMLALIGGDPCTYVEGIFQEYAKSMADDDETDGDISIINKSMSKVEKILDRAIPIQDEILNFCGLSDEWRSADSVTRFLRTVVAYLEDIQCLVLLGGVSELANAHMLGELMYQKGIRI